MAHGVLGSSLGRVVCEGRRFSLFSFFPSGVLIVFTFSFGRVVDVNGG